MKHPYVASNRCGCARCVRERDRRRRQSQSNPWKAAAKRSKKRPSTRRTSRERIVKDETRGGVIDRGDDVDSPSGDW
jgi:hypothetical protein